LQDPLPTGAGTQPGWARAQDLKRTKTICPYCGVGCGINLLSTSGQVAGVEPDFSAPSRGSLCVKGQFASWEFVRSEDRLKYPLIRVGVESKGSSERGPSTSSGRAGAERGGLPALRHAPGPGAAFRRATWDEALDLVASRLKEIAARDGPDALVCWASARVVTEANYLMQKFARVAIGTNNIDNCSRT
jgi:predicted molibdopterin-dependent oxidoreductase YjgC